ncbi:MAG: NAD(P)-dependent alcohol dehydrogenase [Chloroflexi bacterium]|nr:NAD(P)-dependent alcohol dehydrogenase [Chloroflexota bacterium]
MKAIVWTRYGPPEVLQLREVPTPTPQDHEVLIKIHATTVTAGDCEMRNLSLPLWIRLPMRIWIGLLKPRGTTIPGTELAGEIEAAGKDVQRLRVGDPVFGSSGLKFGTCAEYMCLPEDPDEGALAILPSSMTFEEAATVPFGGTEALHFLRKANIQPGHKVLINGAGGSIGTFAVQLAQYYGAEVTGVDTTAKLDMLRAIGTDHIIDYTQEDFAASGATYDVIFDTVGKRSFSRCLRALKPGGCLLLGNPRPAHMLRALWASATSSKRVIFEMASKKLDDLLFLTELVEAGTLTTVIDRRYPLEQIADAHRYVETGQKQGHVVITVGPRADP